MNLTDIKDKTVITVKNFKCIYPGRFQFFGPHHYQNYQYLCDIFGTDNVYIATTDRIEYPDSPLNFLQKKLIIEKFGISANKIFKVKTPYSPKEITDNFNLNNTAVFLALGEKDDGRIDYVKKDGSLTYIQTFNSADTIKPFSENQYVIELPYIKINIPNHGIASGSILRKMICNCSPSFFKEIMGWYDKDIFNMLKNAITNIKETTKLANCVPEINSLPIYLM